MRVSPHCPSWALQAADLAFGQAPAADSASAQQLQVDGVESASSSSTPKQRPSGARPPGPAPSPPPPQQHQSSGGAPQATEQRSPARRLLDGFLGMSPPRGGQSNDSAPPRPVVSGKDSSATATGLAPSLRRPPLPPATPGMAAQLNPAEADRLRGFIDGAEVSVLISSGATTRMHCTHATCKSMCLLQRYSRCCITKMLVGKRLAGDACSSDCSAGVCAGNLSTHGTDLLHPLCAGNFASDGSTLSGPFCLQQQILPRVAQASARALQLATAAAGPETAAAAATALAMGASAAAQSAAARASTAQAALGGAAALIARLQVCRLT